MDTQKLVAYWRESALEDWAVAAKLVRSRHIRHGLFFGHLALEKLLRGSAEMVDEHIVAVVRRYLRNLQAHGMPVDFAVVFGSQATASAGEWSDIDLVVVSPRFDARAHRSDVNLLWRLAARTDSRIEPIPCGERQWREDQVNPILRVARDSGARVAAQAP